jgi:NADPH2:quinone reductase
MRGYITDPSAPGGLRLADDLPAPEPGPGELLVEVKAFAVNRGELSLLEQRNDGWRPGQDVAGVVVEGAAQEWGPPAGARVVGVVDWHGWSERVAVPVAQAAELPEGVTFEQAASLPIAGLTALRALRVAGPLVGARVLVTGATGGVGQFSVQLARAAGARVTALVTSPDRFDEAYALGAERAVVELGDDDGLFDLVLDGVGGEPLRDGVQHLAPGGTAATYGMLAGPAELGLIDFRTAAYPPGKLVGVFHAYPLETRGRDLATLASLVADGYVRPLLGSVRDWTELAVTLAELRDRRIRGKAVLIRS